MKYISPEESRTKQGNLKYLEQLRILARNNRNNPTLAEERIWQWLRYQRLNYKFLRQKPLGKFILDFYCSKLLLAIEIDGESHDCRKYSDSERDLYFLQRGIKTLRYGNIEIINNFNIVKMNLKKEIKKRQVELETHLPAKPDSSLEKGGSVSPFSRGDGPQARGVSQGELLARGGVRGLERKTYFIRIFGCQMNTADAERIAGWYEEQGWKTAKNITQADEIVIVSCSVRQSAENRVYGLVNNITKLPNKPKIILTGCMLRFPKSFLKKKMPGINEFKKIDEYRVRALRLRSGQVHALVPISNGCNNFCTYCVVPYARGREVSRPFAEIVCEVEELAKRGYQEITLLGQNVNSYQPSFAKLLRTLHEIFGIKKISFLTSNPWDLTDEIIEAMSLPKIDRYLHLPVQSGDDEILKSMNRHYTVKQYLNLVEKIRQKIPDIKIGTDIIVGFPGETEDQFNHTVELAKKVGFAKAYVARYSPREQTAAFKTSDDVSPKEKKRRWEILNKLINKK